MAPLYTPPQEANMPTQTDCSICSKEPSHCTNGLCRGCHQAYCTGGGITSSGHYLRATAVNASVMRQSREACTKAPQGT